jgi:hypothetical protein
VVRFVRTVHFVGALGAAEDRVKCVFERECEGRAREGEDEDC